jgi:hypothetical protein
MSDHVPPKTVEEMAAVLLKSGLMDAGAVEAVLRDFRENANRRDEGRDGTAEFLEHLNSAGLSQWQCDKLRDGKWKGYFLEGYELCDKVGREGDWMIYLARKSRPGPTVRVAVQPSRDRPEGFTYRFE